jgi:xylulokinase
VIVYAVDLGTTNVKVVCYDGTGRARGSAQAPMRYLRDGNQVVFDPAAVFDSVLDLIHRTAAEAGAAGEAATIVVTGQAESLVLVDASDRAIGPGISWMDERSGDQAREIAEAFDPVTAFAITGEPEPVATWPATKLRWLAAHRPQVLADTRRVLMIKDYVLLRLTGVAVGEETTRGFTYLYDVPARSYWGEMVEFCGIRLEMLPETVPAGAEVGRALDEVAAALPPAASYTVNAGALDHFCAMLGSGTYAPGAVSASAGTVLALSLLATDWRFDPGMKVSFHPGLRRDDTVLFSCADSGGVSLGWFQDRISPGHPYAELERDLRGREFSDAPLFLPYLTGVNPPDFNADARGAFVDLQLRHDRVDLAYAVMEGVAHLLRRNLEDLGRHGQPVRSITSAGGGKASAYWNQLKADVTGLELRVLVDQEDACRGAAILALVAAGELDSIADTSRLEQPVIRTYRPRSDPARGQRYEAFDSALRRLYGEAAHP